MYTIHIHPKTKGKLPIHSHQPIHLNTQHSPYRIETLTTHKTRDSTGFVCAVFLGVLFYGVSGCGVFIVAGFGCVLVLLVLGFV